MVLFFELYGKKINVQRIIRVGHAKRRVKIVNVIFKITNTTNGTNLDYQKSRKVEKLSKHIRNREKM